MRTFLPQESFDELVGRAVAKAVATNSVDDFVDWFRYEIAATPAAGAWELDADGVRAVGTLLGRSIWGATPAPHNGFKPKPLPAPGRNEACVCGSGLKFKRCCGRGPALPSISAAELWPFVLDALPEAQRKEALESAKVPIQGLVMTAMRSVEAGRHKLAVALLEPLFGQRFAGVGDDHDTALTLLCDAYDALGHERKKLKLLERVRSEAPRSPLRSGACQRLATIALDRGDSAGAWAAFREAQRDEPDSPAVGLLEVQLLTFEHRLDEARERARFWRRRFERLDDPMLDEMIDLLSAIVEDPTSALADVVIDANAGAGQRLREALKTLDSRPLPRYALRPAADAAADADPGAALAARLRGMGVASDQIEAMTRDLLAQLEDLELADPDDADDRDGAEYRIVAPAALGVLEADWHAVYPIGKPFSVNPTPLSDEDPWDLDVEDRWMGFLERHPEAFDSIDILDDLACAVGLHPGSAALGALGAWQRPLAERAVAILRLALDDAATNAAAAEAPDAATDAPADAAPDTVTDAATDVAPDTATNAAAAEAPDAAADAAADAAPDAASSTATGPATGPATITLPWLDTDNRPVLRCLNLAYALAAQLGDRDRAREHAELLLRLNPGDNHGVRAGLMNLLLREGDDEAAVSVSERFRDDVLAEIPYGRVLALVRLGRAREAAEAARDAVRRLPEVRRFLLRERAKRPAISDAGISIGGKDQAWIYREEMRDVWVENPEAMALVRKTRPGA